MNNLCRYKRVARREMYFESEGKIIRNKIQSYRHITYIFTI
jgi:hypothetical protein